jgi:crotonobetainyl-CoA:carnitine CoA-transferase CaiB-like acyl-CoA transferase
VSPDLPESPAPLPLTGVRVLDLTSSIAGPYCTQLLGALGADVVKVEHPVRGDDTRAWGPPFWDEESMMFLAVNAGKRSIGLNLRSEQGGEIARRLAEGCDVLVQSMRPGLCRRLGLGYDQIRALNPKIVYCNIGAFGNGSPLSDRPGYDPLMQAAGGIMSVTGTPGGEPVRVGVSIVDQGTAMWATIGILAALRSRDIEGRGCEVDTSLYETAVGWMGYHLVSHLATGLVPGPAGSRFAGIAPYEAFEAADGWLVIAAPNDHIFEALCQALDRPDLPPDPRFKTNADRVANRDELALALGARVADGGVNAWIDRLAEAGVPAAPVLNTAEVAGHPQTLALGMIQPLPGHAIPDLRMVAPALSFDGQRPVSPSPPPRLGQHADDICKALGFDAARVAELRAQGIVS